jgi:hypothetical protein
VIYVVPAMECPWKAVGVNREVFLNGELSPWHVVHELGHTFGLAHAHGPHGEEYGDPLSPMGHGLADFGAFEKITMGWLRNDVLRADKPGTFRIGRPDDVAATPYALVVQTGRGEYWLEQRPPQLAVRAIEKDVPDDDLAAPTKFIEATAGTFNAPGAFSVRVAQVDPSHADLQFAWTDRVRPTRPTLRAPARVRAGSSFQIAWHSSDTGSGLAACVVRIDGRAVTSTTVGPLSVGVHRLAVSCTDRAGNRSGTTTRRIRVVRG